MKMRHLRSAIVLAMLPSAWACASPLSDSDLYFDPDTLVESPSYPYRTASPGVPTQFISSPGRTIVGANILPILNDNNYFPGYSHSQSDYSVQPNAPGGYFADITSNTLSATFGSSGAYSVRVKYSDGSNDIHSVFVNAGIGNDPYGGAEQAQPASPWKKVDAKQGDLYVISTGANNDGFVNNAVALLGNGANVARAASVADLKAAVEARSRALGRKVKVVVVGHGFQGSIRLGHGDNAERINNSGAANSMSGTDFGNMIKDHVSMINLFGCNTGGGVAGGRLLADITATGVMATAYTSTVGLTDTNWFAYRWGTKVPTPGSVSLLALAGLCAARRRR